MKILDLSQPLFDGCPNCPAHPRVSIIVTGRHGEGSAAPARGDTWHMEQLSFASHTGSHVDAPLHKIPGGPAIDAFPLERWTGRAVIVDLRGIDAGARIDAPTLAAKTRGDVRDAWILLATGFGQKRAATHEWLHDAPALTEDGAAWLAAHNARGVGIDHFSIGDAATHAVLLQKPVLIVEELFFSDDVMALAKTEAPLTLMALPINLRGHSGAPCRPVLLVEEARR